MQTESVESLKLSDGQRDLCDTIGFDDSNPVCVRACLCVKPNPVTQPNYECNLICWRRELQHCNPLLSAIWDREQAEREHLGVRLTLCVCVCVSTRLGLQSGITYDKNLNTSGTSGQAEWPPIKAVL